jgi:hypothetical protein
VRAEHPGLLCRHWFASTGRANRRAARRDRRRTMTRKETAPMKLRSLLKGTPAHPPLTQSPDPDPRCTAIRYNGQRCKLPRGTGTDKCAIHKAAP